MSDREIKYEDESVENSAYSLIQLAGNIAYFTSQLNQISSDAGKVELNLAHITIAKDRIESNIQKIKDIADKLLAKLQEYRDAEVQNIDIIKSLLENLSNSMSDLYYESVYGIPVFPDRFQTDEEYANINFGKDGLGTDGCGVFSCYYILTLLGNTEITPTYIAEKIYKGNPLGGSDGGNFGALAQILELFRSKNTKKRNRSF